MILKMMAFVFFGIFHSVVKLAAICDQHKLSGAFCFRFRKFNQAAAAEVVCRLANIIGMDSNLTQINNRQDLQDSLDFFLCIHFPEESECTQSASRKNYLLYIRNLLEVLKLFSWKLSLND